MRFRDQPIARKALTLGVVPAIPTLGIVVATMTAAVFVSVRTETANSNEALVAIIADNISAAVGFHDSLTATELLRGFRADGDIDQVCVYDSDGRLFASYVAPGRRCEPNDLSLSVTDPTLQFVQAVTVGDRRVGTVHMTANADALHRQIRALGLFGGLAFALSTLIAFVLSRQMQRAITEPITALAHTASQVGDTRDFSVRAQQTTNDEVGRLVSAFNLMLDQIQRQDRMKDDFLATLSHELRTPLNATLGWLQILQKTSPDPPRVERALTSIERNARAQQRVVEDLLDISRIVTGRLQMKTTVLDLRTALAAAIEVVAETAAQKSIALHSQAPAVPCLVSGDGGRLQQVFWNLLSNSVKFTKPGGSVSVTLESAGRDYRVTVRDTGIGIGAEFLPRVFDRFQQADSSATREQGGLGLGLAIVKEIAILHGGTVSAESDGPGTGATFTLTLPQLLDGVTTGTSSAESSEHRDRFARLGE
jgi:signal transduction histidine kinase